MLEPFKIEDQDRRQPVYVGQLIALQRISEQLAEIVEVLEDILMKDVQSQGGEAT